MKVSELITMLKELDQDREIRYDSYEFLGDFEMDGIREDEYKGVKYYCIE